MSISDERAEELRRLYKETHDQDISLEEAKEMGSRLVMLYQLLMRPLPGGKGSEPPQPPAQTGA